MPKIHCEVGYETFEDTGLGDYEPVVTKRHYKGDLITVSKSFNQNEGINDDLRVSNRISLIADAYAYDHFFGIVYVYWAGQRWKVSNVTVERPRLILTLGGVYNATPK